MIFCPSLRPPRPAQNAPSARVSALRDFGAVTPPLPASSALSAERGKHERLADRTARGANETVWARERSDSEMPLPGGCKQTRSRRRTWKPGPALGLGLGFGSRDRQSPSKPLPRQTSVVLTSRPRWDRGAAPVSSEEGLRRGDPGNPGPRGTARPSAPRAAPTSPAARPLGGLRPLRPPLARGSDGTSSQWAAWRPGPRRRRRRRGQ